MNEKSEKELQLIVDELRSICNALDSIGTSVRNEFEGIGNEMCAESIEYISEHYREVRKTLACIDKSKVTDDFKNRGL